MERLTIRTNEASISFAAFDFIALNALYTYSQESFRVHHGLTSMQPKPLT